MPLRYAVAISLWRQVSNLPMLRNFASPGKLETCRYSLRASCLSLLLWSLGCAPGVADREDEIPAPLFGVEKDLSPGLSPEAVRKLLGTPENDFVDRDYNPPVIRVLDYDALGLYLQFHTTKGLGHVMITRRWTKAVQGLRYGDRLDPTEFKGNSGVKAFHSPHWNGAFFFFEKEPDCFKIRNIVLEDKAIYGKWSTTIKLGGW